jgi:hypothetical protein
MRSLFTLMFGRTQSPVALSSAGVPQADTAVAPPTLPQPASRAQTYEIPMDQHRQFPAAALSQDGLQPTGAAQLCVIHRNAGVQRAAEALQRELHRLVDASALGIIAQAVRRTDGDVTSLTPEQVLASLQQMRAEVTGEITAAGVERTVHLRAFHDVLAPVQQLREVVAQRAAAASAEAQTLRWRLDALDQWRPGHAPDRHQALRQHLNDEQLAALGVVDNVTAIAEIRARLAALNEFVAACAAFHADEHFDVRHLDGHGFGAEIEAARDAGAVLPA